MAKTKFTIGRDRSADIPLADPSVSRLHAEVNLLDNGGLFVTDCNSSNGTFLHRDGAPRQIRQETIRASDQIQFGNVVIAASDLIAVAQTAATPQRPQALPRSAKLIRCGCGAVKALGSECPFCGD